LLDVYYFIVMIVNYVNIRISLFKGCIFVKFISDEKVRRIEMKAKTKLLNEIIETMEDIDEILARRAYNLVTLIIRGEKDSVKLHNSWYLFKKYAGNIFLKGGNSNKRKEILRQLLNVIINLINHNYQDETRKKIGKELVNCIKVFMEKYLGNKK